MLFALILMLATVAFAADLFHFFRQRHLGARPNYGLLVWALLTDALPLTIVIAGWIVKDNTPEVMAMSMWAFWGWMVTVIPRMSYYVFNFFSLPRLGMGIAAAITVLFIWGATWGRTSLQVKRVEICSDRFPASFNDLRIVQLSDIHLGALVDPAQEIQAIVDSVKALSPDLIVFTGDLVNIRHSELDSTAMRMLSTLHAPFGVVSVIGNHDVGAYITDTVKLPREVSRQRLVAQQRAMGWCVLEDSTIYLRRGADSISLSGVDYDATIRKRRHDKQLPSPAFADIYRGVPQGIYNITLAHLPQLWEQITATGYGDLTLSGHVHGMQTKLRVGDWAWSPAKWMYDRWSGRYDADAKTLYINDGTGYVAYPMRLGAFPEITLITLSRCA